MNPASWNNIQRDEITDYSNTKKLSEVIMDYAQPLSDQVDGIQEKANAVRMAIAFWNASLFPKQKALETIVPFIADVTNGDQKFADVLYPVFEMMFERKQNQFSNDNRCVVEFSIIDDDDNDSFYLQVASTPLKT